MEDSLEARLAGDDGDALSALRQLIGRPTVLPFDDPFLSTLVQLDCDASSLATARELLENGVTPDVENIQEPYKAGVPVGLPGGLAQLALQQERQFSFRNGKIPYRALVGGGVSAFERVLVLARSMA